MARSSLPLRLLPLALALQAIHAPTHAANYTVADGTTDTAAKTLTKNGADNITVNAGGTLASGSAATIRTSQDNDNLSTVTINNAGTIGQNSGLTAISINHKKVNLILNKEAVPERIQDECTPDALSASLRHIMSHEGRAQMAASLVDLRRVLSKDGASARVARNLIRPIQ